MFDVVVIGGNLAGASAAIKAVENGLKVALIERIRNHYFLPVMEKFCLILKRN